MFRRSTSIRFLILVMAGALLLALTPPASAQGQNPGPDDAGGGQIIGGAPSTPGDYPFLVALVDSTEGNSFQGQSCGGSVVAPTWILTAAHCVVDGDTSDVAAPSSLDVIIGRHDLDCVDFGAGTACTEGMRHSVIAVHPHPDYDIPNSNNDVAMLQLETPTTTIVPINWATAADTALYPAGTSATVTGWGNLQSDSDLDPEFPPVPHVINVDVISDADCVGPDSQYFASEIFADSMLCAGDLINGGIDSCQGDSGGPLVVPNGGSSWVQIGVVSWGIGCADAGFPGVYAEVAHFNSFIAGFVGATTAECDGEVVTIDMNTNGGNGTGTAGADVILGTPGPDFIKGLGGDDTICGGGGADTIKGGPGADTILGEGGADIIDGGGGADVISGGPQGDTIRGQGGSDTINGNGGDDTIHGQGAADFIFGDAGADTINGQNGADFLIGGPGPDVIKGQTGPDDLDGEGGDDTLIAGNGNDTLYGGPGNDSCAGNLGGNDFAEAATCEKRSGIEALF